MSRSLATVLFVVVVGLAGCANSGGSGKQDSATVVDQDGNPPPDASVGYVVFSVEWPERTGLQYVIDPNTEWFRIRVKEAAGTAYFADLVYPATSVALEVPVGTYTANVLGLRDETGANVNPQLLSYGATSGIVVVQYQTTNATVTLAASSAWFSQAPNPAYYGSLPTVGVTMSNYPIEIPQAAFNFRYLIQGYTGGDPNFPLSATLCSMAATSATDDPMVRGCTATNPLPSDGTSIEFHADLVGTAFAVDWGGGPTLFPESYGYDGLKWLTIHSGSIPFSEAPPTGISVTIQ